MKPGKSILVMIVMLALIMSACGPAGQTAEVETYTVGIVNYVPVFDPLIEGFKIRMTELGYIEGVNITYIYEQASGLDAVEGLVASYIGQNVDLILSASTPVTQIVAEATAGSGVPVVFGGVTDAVTAGIVASVESPGGNITGVAIGNSANTDRLAILLEIMPDIKRLYAPLNTENDSVRVAAEAVHAYAESIGVEMIEPPIVTEEDALDAINSIPSNVDAFFVYPDTLITQFPDEMIDASLNADIPLLPPKPDMVESGALFSASNDWVQTGKDVADKADQVLQGTKPADIPVTFDQVFLTINLGTAEELGITIPTEILDRADTIIL